LEDDLDIEFVLAQFNTMVPRLQEILVDPQVMIALGDGGAHVDMLCDCGYPTYLLGTWVRERQAMPLERAVQRLTGGSGPVMPPTLRSSIPRRSARRTAANGATTCRVVRSAW
jgi:N-acyl-D-aspartate/D-glutamate deacylase